MWVSCFREEWKRQKGVNFYDCTVGIANLLILWGQLLTQNDSSLVLPIIREVLKNFGGAMAPPMHKVAPPLLSTYISIKLKGKRISS